MKRKIEEAIEAQKTLIASLAETSKPVAPDNAIGRLSRMEALNDRAVSEASLNAARHKLSRLETALGKVDQPDFGICVPVATESHPARPHIAHARGHPLCPLRGEELMGQNPILLLDLGGLFLYFTGLIENFGGDSAGLRRMA